MVKQAIRSIKYSQKDNGKSEKHNRLFQIPRQVLKVKSETIF